MKLLVHLTKETTRIEIKLPSEISIVEYQVSGLHSATQVITSYIDHRTLTIDRLSDEKQIVVKAKLAGVLDDSGYGYYPYVTSYFRMSAIISGINEISVLVELPSGSGPYSMFTYFQLNETRYVWGSRAKENELPIDYYSKGEGRQAHSILGANYISKTDSIKIGVEAPFRIKTVNLPGLAILPLLIGLPFIVIWGLPEPDISLLTKLSSSLAATPVFFAVWQRNTAESQDPLDFINSSWFLSSIAWIAYAFFFHLSRNWLTADFLSFLFLTPYFVWIAYNLGVLVWFRNNPTERGKIPKAFITFALTRSLLVYLQDLRTHKGELFEPEAMLIRTISVRSDDKSSFNNSRRVFRDKPQGKTIESKRIAIIALIISGCLLVWQIVSFVIERTETLYEPQIQISKEIDLTLHPSDAIDSGVGMPGRNGTMIMYNEEIYHTEVIHTVVYSSPHDMAVRLTDSFFVLDHSLSFRVPEDLLAQFKVELNKNDVRLYVASKENKSLDIQVPIVARVPIASTNLDWSFERPVVRMLLGEFSVILEFSDVQTGQVRYLKLMSDIYYSDVQ